MPPSKKPTKRGSKKHKVPTPGTESRKVFTAALVLAKDLLNSKGLWIKLDETGNAELVISGEKLEAIPKDKFKDGLTREYLLSLIATEFESLVKVTTYSEPTVGLQVEIPDEILKEKGTDEFLWRLEEVKKELVPPNLKERVILRKTSQGFVLQNATWQVITKKHDQDRGKLSDIPCGCLSLTYSSLRSNPTLLRLGAKGVSVELPTVREPNRLTLELHHAEVEELIETLTDLRDNLEKVKKGK